MNRMLTNSQDFDSVTNLTSCTVPACKARVATSDLRQILNVQMLPRPHLTMTKVISMSTEQCALQATLQMCQHLIDCKAQLWHKATSWQQARLQFFAHGCELCSYRLCGFPSALSASEMALWVNLRPSISAWSVGSMPKPAKNADSAALYASNSRCAAP